MKRSFIFAMIFFLLRMAAGAQEEKRYQEAVDQFTSLYNAGRYDSIFRMFAPAMARALPEPQTKTFFADLQKDAGSILSVKWEAAETDYVAYVLRCERQSLSLYVSLDNRNRIAGLYLKPYLLQPKEPVIERNKTKLILPFTGTWMVYWGGDTKALNYHVSVPAQKHAFDFVITDSLNRSYKTGNGTNEDYYAFGKEIIAPCDATVVLAVDGIKDNIPGQVNPLFVTGNTVVLRTAQNEYLFFAHFKKHSIKVKEGDTVRTGQLLGLCGNSGNSTEPHLHFHIQHTEDMNTGIGAKCYFGQIRVNGVVKKEYSPVKGELVENTGN